MADVSSSSSFLGSLDLQGFDLNDHHSLTKQIISLNGAFITLVALITGLRMFVRIVIIRAAGLDDSKAMSIQVPCLPEVQR